MTPMIHPYLIFRLAILAYHVPPLHFFYIFLQNKLYLALLRQYFEQHLLTNDAFKSVWLPPTPAISHENRSTKKKTAKIQTSHNGGAGCGARLKRHSFIGQFAETVAPFCENPADGRPPSAVITAGWQP